MKFKVGDLVKRVGPPGYLMPIFEVEKGVGLIERCAFSYVMVHWLTSDARISYHMSEIEYLSTGERE